MSPPPPLRFHPDYRETVTLRSGASVTLRMIRPDDKALLEDGFRRMSPEARYYRFLSYRDRLTRAELAYLTELDLDDHLAIGVGREDGHHETGLGLARFIRLDDPTIAEAAIVVLDEAQGQGLGRLLFERLVPAAFERGVRTFRFEILADNEAMLALLRRIFPTAHTTQDDAVLIIDCPLPDPTAAAALPTDSRLYRLFQLAAEGAIRVLRRPRWPDALRASASADLARLADAVALNDSDGPAPTSACSSSDDDR